MYCNQTNYYEISQSSFIKIDPGCSLKIYDHLFHVPQNIIPKSEQIYLYNTMIPKINLKQILNQTAKDTINTFTLDKFATAFNLKIGNLTKQLASLYSGSKTEINRIKLDPINFGDWKWYLIYFIFGLIGIRVIIQLHNSVAPDERNI